jgi:hypothetical protein
LCETAESAVGLKPRRSGARPPPDLSDRGAPAAGDEQQEQVGERAWAGPFEHLLQDAWSPADRVFPGLLLEDRSGAPEMELVCDSHEMAKQAQLDVDKQALSLARQTGLGRRTHGITVLSERTLSKESTIAMSTAATVMSLDGFHATQSAQRADELVRALFDALNADDPARTDAVLARSFLSYDVHGTRSRTGLKRYHADLQRSFSELRFEGA